MHGLGRQYVGTAQETLTPAIDVTRMLRLSRLRECWRMLWRFTQPSGGYCVREESGEWRARWPAARCPGEPLAEAEEVEAGGGEDMAAVDLRLPTIARAAQAATADPTGERALDSGAERVRFAEVVGGLAPTSCGAQGLALRARAQAEGAPGRAACGAATHGSAWTGSAVLARELDPDQRSPGGIRALSPADTRPPDRAGRLFPPPVELEIVEREAIPRARLPLVVGPRRPA